MVAAHEPASPVASLQRLASALQAAMTLVLGDAGEKPVHQLRTTTRRVEAQLALVEYLGKVPSDLEELRATRKVLRRVRRTAGTVRDVDVHADLLKTYAAGETPALTGQTKRDAARTLKLRQHVETLGAALAKRRTKQVRKLERTLLRRQESVTAALNEFMALVPAAESWTITPARLRTDVNAWFRQQSKSHHVPERSEAELHATRKAAKMARYLAEMSPSTAALAQRFEALQDAGGHWHDLLTLAETAEAELGRKSPLSVVLRRDAQHAHERFREDLKRFRSQSAPNEKASRPRASKKS